MPSVFGPVSSSTFDTGSWHHVLGVLDTSLNKVRIYVNGNLEGSGDFTGTPREYGASSYFIGCADHPNPSYPYWFTGVIDDVRMYGRAVSSDEAAAYARSRSRPVKFTAATRLAFITPPRTVKVNTSSDSILVRAQWSDGSKAGEYNDLCSFSSVSAAGRFCADKDGETWTPIITLRMSGGETYVFYKDTKVGSQVITVTSGGLTETSQAQVITADKFNETASFIILKPGAVPADGTTACTVVVTVLDRFQNPVPGKNVIITSSRKGTADDTFDTIAQPALPTDDNGQATGTLVSSMGGYDTVTATIQGEDQLSRITQSYFDNAPIAMWNFDETAGSVASGMLPGTVYGATWQAGRFGNCLSFDGVNDYVDVQHSELLHFKNAVTVEAWVNNSGGTSWQGIVYKNNFFMLRRDADAEGGKISFFANAGGALEPRVNGIQIPAGSWFHIVGTYDYDKDVPGSNLKIYVNGELKGQVIRAGELDTSTGPVYIGYEYGTDYFNGMIDGVRIYNRALSADEVAMRYASGISSVRFISASKLAFITPERSVQPGFVSDSIAVQAQWGDGSKASGYNGYCQFSTSSGLGKFCASQAGDTWASALTVKMENGETYVFYRDSRPGSPTLTVSSAGLQGATQTASVAQGSFSGTASYITVSSSTVPANGVTPCTMIVSVTDSARNPMQGMEAVLHTGRGFDTIAYPFGQTTDASGKCTAVVVSSVLGSVTPAFTVTGYPDTITQVYYQDALAGFWNFEEGTGASSSDLSGNNNIGTLSGAGWTTGRFGYGFDMDGENAFMTVPHSPGMYLTDAITVEVWIYPTDSAKQFNRVIEKGWDAEGSYILMVMNSTAYFGLDLDGVQRGISGGAITNNQWHHLAGTFDGSNIRLYVNGSLIGSTAYMKSFGNSATFYVSGAGHNACFKGIIDEVKIYNKSLTGDEVKADYENRAGQMRFSAGKLKFASAPFRVRSGGVSAAVSINASDAAGNTDDLFGEAALLSTSSESGSFSSNGIDWSAPGSDSSVYFSEGQASFYYLDYASGRPVITVSRAGLSADTQAEIVSASRAVFASSSFRMPSTQVSDTVTVVMQDELGNTDAGWSDTIGLVSNSVKARFSVSRTPWSDTTVVYASDGLVTFFYKDAKGGTSAIYVASSDLTGYQLEYITMPVIIVQKFQRKDGVDPADYATTSPISVGQEDTVEWKLLIRNAGTETAINVIVTDKDVFDTSVFSAVAFVSLNTHVLTGNPVDSWAYSTDPALAVWEAWGSVPGPVGADVKGLRWFINTLVPGETRSVRFKVRIK